VVLVIGVVVATVISVSAVIDPFSWMPPIGEVWADCTDDYATSADECDLESRYPGFWVHALANFAWAVASVVSLGWLGRTVMEVREARPRRFIGPGAVERFEEARSTLAAAGCLCATLAGLPLAAAIL
jgi:hypothetical protein